MPRKASSRKRPIRPPAVTSHEIAASPEKDQAGQSPVAQPLAQRELAGSVVIDLQEGFVDDTVAIRVGDIEIFRRENVSTDMLLGMAGSVEARVPEGPVTVEVSVPSRRLADAVKLNVPPNAHLGVALREQQLHFRISNEGFTYF
jgi:hypothetical protein